MEKITREAIAEALINTESYEDSRYWLHLDGKTFTTSFTFTESDVAEAIGYTPTEKDLRDPDSYYHSMDFIYDQEEVGNAFFERVIDDFERQINK